MKIFKGALVAVAAVLALLLGSVAIGGPGEPPVVEYGHHNHALVVPAHPGHDHDAADDPDAELDVLADDCSDSDLPDHDGFQKAPRCSSAVFGEISDAANNPTLLITEAPAEVDAGTGFVLEVSTRNLIRDRFLPAAQGGYYLESSVLNEDGLQRGHFHVSCRVLARTDEAPIPDRAPEFFEAVEDGAGGAEPDVVRLEVPPTNEDGEQLFESGDLVQCAAWAGDGSHRIPMMERANQNPAFDAVRLTVR